MNNVVQISDFPAQPATVDSDTLELTSSLPDGYALFDDGVYALAEEEAGEPIFICSPLRVDAGFADLAGTGWGKLISVKSPDGVWHDVPVMNAHVTRAPGDVVARLVNHGLELGPERKCKELLLALLGRWKPTRRMTSVSRLGWVGENRSAFALGKNVIGQGAFLPLLDLARGPAAHLVTNGSLSTWKTDIGMKCRGNPMMVLAVSLAFSGPLLACVGMDGGGLHFRGASSSGKTTLLHLAASVWGSADLITQWRATSNGLESIAANLNDILLPLDEIAEISARALQETIYMLANGTGKARMTKGITPDEIQRWRLALISSGEISVAEKLKEAGQRQMAGQEARLIDIEADSRAHGAFDDLHGSETAAMFADMLKAAAKTSHGAVGHAFVRGMLDHQDKVDNVVRTLFAKLCKESLGKLPQESDGVVSRVAQRFALVGVAGELATAFKLTGWDEGDAHKFATAAFLDWHDRIHGAKHEGLANVIVPIQQFLTAKLDTLPEVGTLVSSDPIGWKDASRVFLTADCWHQIYPGSTAATAATALMKMSLLLLGEDGRHMKKAPRAIPGRPRLYTLKIADVMRYKPI
ncbi:DUF927 domain-containing protein [Cypionkella psychrotolerans]|uniref:DUF927 domain-containing protein n=1 Tax=Cypionkella psychrotolerans TaxID=1678131 RepID=UPI0006B59D14|nr:DUF927 domain-containing protein [Cypionkella psychrotolerans]